MLCFALLSDISFLTHNLLACSGLMSTMSSTWMPEAFAIVFWLHIVALAAFNIFAVLNWLCKIIFQAILTSFSSFVIYAMKYSIWLKCYCTWWLTFVIVLVTSFTMSLTPIYSGLSLFAALSGMSHYMCSAYVWFAARFVILLSGFLDSFWHTTSHVVHDCSLIKWRCRYILEPILPPCSYLSLAMSSAWVQ